MDVADLFVGGVAVALGIGGLFAALANGDAYYSSAKIRWIERVAGGSFARILFALIGLALIAIGLAIAIG